MLVFKLFAKGLTFNSSLKDTRLLDEEEIKAACFQFLIKGYKVVFPDPLKP